MPRPATLPTRRIATPALLCDRFDSHHLDEQRELNDTPAPNPYARIGDPRAQSNDNRNAFLHTFDNGSPFQGAALAVHLLRLYSLVLGAVTIVLTYTLAREILPERPLIALGAAAFVAFLPQFIFITAAISNDNLATLLTVATLWQLIRIMRRGLTQTRTAILDCWSARRYSQNSTRSR